MMMSEFLTVGDLPKGAWKFLSSDSYFKCLWLARDKKSTDADRQKFISDFCQWFIGQSLRRYFEAHNDISLGELRQTMIELARDFVRNWKHKPVSRG
jgi:sulfur relay (sulfurtransferase) DsrC/TusE family protein